MSTIEDLFRPPERLRRLQIEVTTLCNLFCQECSRTIAVQEGTWKDKHLSLENFETLVANSPPADVLVLQGVGEPTLNPELLEITASARASGRFKHITLNSNAVTRTPDYFRRLREAGLDYICVSVDSFNPEVAERCRSGTKVPKMKHLLREIYREFGHIVISVVASKLNMFDLPALLDELDTMGEELFPNKRFTVEIQPVINYKTEATNQPRTMFNRAELEMLRNMLKAIDDALPRLAVVFNTATIEAPKPGHRCGRPFFSPYINVDGFMTPCCTSFDPATYQHTNILFTPMVDAWKSPVIQDWLSHYFRAGDEICKGCCFDIGSLLRPEASE
jgi:MoaA/NifB/PqqE/SkfB family radical SAM enzyme